MCKARQQAAEAQLALLAEQAGDGLLEEMEEAVAEGEGRAQISIFEVVRECLGKEVRKARHPAWMQETQAKRPPRVHSRQASAIYAARCGTKWQEVGAKQRIRDNRLMMSQ